MKLRGIVKGQTIEFDSPIGLPEGQCVEIDIRPVESTETSRSRDGKDVCASASSDTGGTAATQSRASMIFPAIPAGGNPVTNEKVNDLREQLGI